MDRRLAALGGILGFTWWRSRKKRAVLAPTTPDPADELRAKLAEARDADDRDEFESGEKPVDEAADVETKRRDAHERARAAMDDLRPE